MAAYFVTVRLDVFAGTTGQFWTWGDAAAGPFWAMLFGSGQMQTPNGPITVTNAMSEHSFLLTFSYVPMAR